MNISEILKLLGPEFNQGGDSLQNSFVLKKSSILMRRHKKR